METIDLFHFDYIVIGVIALSGFIAFFRGFIQEALSLALWVIAFASSMFLNQYLDPYISEYLINSELRRILSIILVLSSILMIILVLLHKGKGSGLSDLFGGGISSTSGGSSVVEKNLDRITIVVGGIWFASVIALSLLLK